MAISFITQADSGVFYDLKQLLLESPVSTKQLCILYKKRVDFWDTVPPDLIWFDLIWFDLIWFDLILSNDNLLEVITITEL